MLLLAAVRFPFLVHARTNLAFTLLFCQPVSFLDIEYHTQSHFSSYHDDHKHAMRNDFRRLQ